MFLKFNVEKCSFAQLERNFFLSIIMNVKTLNFSKRSSIDPDSWVDNGVFNLKNIAIVDTKIYFKTIINIFLEKFAVSEFVHVRIIFGRKLRIS